MRWGRSIALLVVAIAVGGLIYEGQRRTRKPADDVHPVGLAPADIAKVTVSFGANKLVLESAKPNEWTLPGNWPVRQAEARELVRLLAIHDGRFEPEEVGANSAEWATLGLDKPTATAELTPRSGRAPIYIAFGLASSPTGANKFSEPTYARINDGTKAWRLAPGLVDQITRPLDYYRQRRLFAGIKPPRDPDAGVPRPGDPIRREQLDGKELVLEQTNTEPGSSGSPIRLAREGQGAFASWKMKEPGGPDNLNPTVSDTLLATVPDLWAERFYSEADAPVAKTGLDKPTKTIRVVAENGQTTVLRIGSVSRTRSFKRLRPPPQGAPPGFPPGEETVKEEYRFAKLEANSQIFEIKAASLATIFVAADTLRDPNPARFAAADVVKVTVESGMTPFTLVKKDASWKIERAGSPVMEAEASRVTELLGRLSGMDARDKDVIAPATPEKRKELGLEKPATVFRISVKETAAAWPKDASGNRPTRERTVVVNLGRHDDKSKKVAIAVDGINRLNEVDDAAFATLTRPAVAYRERKVINLAATKIQSIKILPKGAKEPTVLVRDGKNWVLSGTVKTSIDETLAAQLSNALASVEATELVSETPDPKALGPTYGIDDAATKVEIVSETEMGKPPATLVLRLGKAKPIEPKPETPRTPGQPPEAPEKPSYYARIEGKPELFLVASDLQTQIARPLLNWLPANPLKVTDEDLVGIKMQKPGQPLVVIEQGIRGPVAPEAMTGPLWQIKQPFDAETQARRVEPLVSGLTNFKADYQMLKADATTEAAFGAKATKLTLVRKDKSEIVLEIGDLPGKPGLARIAGQTPVFQLPGELTTVVLGAPLNLLDPVGLAIDTTRVEGVKFFKGTETHELAKASAATPPTPPMIGSGWVVKEKDKEKEKVMPADTEGVSTLLGTLFNLRGGRIVDYGTKIDFKKYGLDQPSFKVTVRLKPLDAPGAAASNPPAKNEHQIDLGAAVPDEPGARYARIDSGPAVISLSLPVVAALERKALDLVDRVVARIDPKEVSKIRLIKDKETVELVRNGDAWRQATPGPIGADATVVANWLGELARFRADKVVAFKPADPKALGLDPGFARVEFESAAADGKTKTVKLLIGNTSGPGRVVRLEGGDIVGEFPMSLVNHLLPSSLYFRNRSVATVPTFDGATLERGSRKITLTREGPFWKMTAPANAEVDSDLVGSMLNNLGKLKADEFLGDKATPEKLKELGLEKPLVKWNLTLAGKPVLELQLGNRQADGRVAARIAKGEILFLISSALSNKLLGEIRLARNVWEPGLDAVQIDTIRIVPRTGEPLFLLKKDNGWEIAGKPSVKVLTETVNDTLGALAGLRLERYAADKDADLKIFGLAPAEYTIEVTGRSGIRTLKIGGTEEGTPRRYAVADKTPAGEVLILSASDVGRILRSVADFGKPPPLVVPAENTPPPLPLESLSPPAP